MKSRFFIRNPIVLRRILKSWSEQIIKKGYPGAQRSQSEKIDRQKGHTLKICPECQDELVPPMGQRTSYIEDIPQISIEVTEHTVIGIVSG